ncbi:hypothetical protein N9M16_05690 [Candidatus Dependentiae bacterium]|nr:hypothetical protein [Candidatus Dependentiae bacterium]
MVAQVVTRSSSARPPPTREWEIWGQEALSRRDRRCSDPPRDERSEEPSRPFANRG